ncbi:MAG: dihydrolipoyl dehydrogenase [Candidatus Fimivivens sp.]
MNITVIGGGPGGYVAAIQAAILGGAVTLIEKQTVGGTCLNRGCIPTKALLAGTDMLNTTQHAGTFGVHFTDAPHANYGEIVARKDQVVGQLVGGVQFLLKKRGIKIVTGTAQLKSATAVEVTKPDGTVEIVESERIILATGSVPVVPEMFAYDGEMIFTSNEALAQSTQPDTIIIVGGGVIGCEFAQFYARMGTKVTIIEMADHILPLEDADAAQTLKKALKAQGVVIYEKNGVASVKKADGMVTVLLQSGDTVQASCMLVSVGRKAYTEGLGLEALDIATEKGKIVVDDHMRTNVPGIYAIGDLVDTMSLAHVASREGTVAAQNALGQNQSVSYHAVPRCIYTAPEVAGVGLTEAEATKLGIAYRKGMFRFAGIGKAIVANQTAGFVKVLTNEQDVIIGASIIGAHATELIGEMTVLVHAGVTATQAGQIIHAHPTFCEALMEAIHDVHGQSAHAY